MLRSTWLPPGFATETKTGMGGTGVVAARARPPRRVATRSPAGRLLGTDRLGSSAQLIQSNQDHCMLIRIFYPKLQQFLMTIASMLGANGRHDPYVRSQEGRRFGDKANRLGTAVYAIAGTRVYTS